MILIYSANDIGRKRCLKYCLVNNLARSIIHRKYSQQICSFGKRNGHSNRRANDCLVLEPSEMILVSYISAFFPASRRAAKGKKIRTSVRMCAPYGQTPFPVRIFSDAFSRITIAYVVRLVEASKLKKEFWKSL